MQSLPTVSSVADFVSQFVDKSWPNDRDVLYQMLDLVQEHIWKSGLFLGSTKWAYVKTRCDNTIITPHGYSELLGAKLGCKMLDLRDQYFMFHQNGPMTEPAADKSYSTDVTHLGTYPTLINHWQEAELKCKIPEYQLTVISPCLPNMREPLMTRVCAYGLDGRPIYTYYFTPESLTENPEDEIMVLTPDDVTTSEGVVEGVNLPITRQGFTPSNILISEIYNIEKQPSHFSVEYWLVDRCSKKGILAARLEPFQLRSSYNVYKINNNRCSVNNCIFALFKRSRPDPCVADSQLFITDNKLAITYIAQGIYEKVYKKNITTGDALLISGERELAKELKESNSAVHSPLQIHNHRQDARRNFR